MKRGRFQFYDKQQVLKDIVSGKMSAGEIAEKHKITRDMVYTLKYNARKKNIIRDNIQKLDELDTVEPPNKSKAVNKIIDLAIDYADNRISLAEMSKQISLLWPY